MTNEEYLVTSDMLGVVIGIVAPLDLDGFLERARHAESVGPFIDPTLYQAASAKIGVIIRVAEAARNLQKVIEESANV